MRERAFQPPATQKSSKSDIYECESLCKKFVKDGNTQFSDRMTPLFWFIVGKKYIYYFLDI